MILVLAALLLAALPYMSFHGYTESIIWVVYVVSVVSFLYYNYRLWSNYQRGKIIKPLHVEWDWAIVIAACPVLNFLAAISMWFEYVTFGEDFSVNFPATSQAVCRAYAERNNSQ